MFYHVQNSTINIKGNNYMEKSRSYSSYMKSPYYSLKVSTYFDAYDNLFARYIDKEITFVEIGIFNGGSLFMWRDFFGPKARIIGIDLNPNAKKWESHGFEIYIGSQSDESFWKAFLEKVGPIDVVLDDGGHTYEQQIITTECLLDSIKDGGMLVVEDTHTSYMRGFGFKRFSFINYVKNHIDKINRRFGSSKIKNYDNRVWSIQVFESIVAFHINRKASQLKSSITENDGIKDNSKDYRHEEINSQFENRRFLKSKFLKKMLGRIITNFRSFKTSRKFR